MLGLPSRADVYGAALEGLVRVNELILDKRPDLPPLYAAGIRWKNIPHDNWRRADTIAASGWGDCEGISSWRVAELRKGRGVYGEYDPDARVNCYHTGPKKYHAIVMRGNDLIEDPSVACGMRARPEMPLTRAEMNLLNGQWPARQPFGRASVACVAGDDEWGEGITTDFVANPDGTTSAQIKIPLADGTQIVANTAPLKLDGLLKRPGDFLEANAGQLAKLGPWGKVAAEIIKQPLARQARQKTHDLLRQIPGFGRIF
jgi:hypothetical protein